MAVRIILLVLKVLCLVSGLAAFVGYSILEHRGPW